MPQGLMAYPYTLSLNYGDKQRSGYVKNSKPTIPKPL